MKALKAGILYFLLVFTAGFVLGAVRELVVSPALGPFAATLIEGPVMLGVSFLVARWIIVGRVLSPMPDRAAMGGTGLICLLSAEIGFSLLLRGWSFLGWLEHIASPQGLLSLALFAAFAVIPLAIKPTTEPEVAEDAKG